MPGWCLSKIGGFVGQRLYFDNYTAVGDIIVLSICFVIAILIATSYNTRIIQEMIIWNMY